MCLANIGAERQSSCKSHTADFAAESSTSVWRSHDAGIWNTVVAIMQGLPGSDIQIREAQQVATPPMRMGGLGLRSATRCAEAAYWASWADALHMVGQRNPEVADMVVRTVSQREPPREGCLAELQAGARLDREGFWWRPTWQALRDGARPEEYVWVNPASGNTAGSIGRLLSLTRFTGRRLCCQSVQPPAVPTCVLTRVPMLEQLWPTLPPRPNTRSLLTCSG